MTFILRHWKIIRGVSLLVAASLLITAGMTAASASADWIFGAVISFLCAFVFAFTYPWAFLARAVAEANHRLFNSMNPKAIWVQKSLLWLSLAIITLQSIEMAFPSENADIDRFLGFAIGTCGTLGLFIGCGNFLTKERNDAGQSDDAPDAERSL